MLNVEFFLKNNIISLILPDGLNEVYCQIRVKKVTVSCQKHNSEFYGNNEGDGVDDTF